MEGARARVRMTVSIARMCEHVCVCTRAHVCVCACVRACVRAYRSVLHVCVNVCIRLHIHICVCMHVCLCMWMRARSRPGGVGAARPRWSLTLWSPFLLQWGANMPMSHLVPCNACPGRASIFVCTAFALGPVSKHGA